MAPDTPVPSLETDAYTPGAGESMDSWDTGI